MNNSIYSLPVFFTVKNEVEAGDGRFLQVIIDVLNTGLNVNKSYFTKEVVDENIETIKNTPILGFITKDTFGDKDFKGHEYILTKTDKDGIKRKYIGSAFGVIPESCNPRWIQKETEDGTILETLQVDGLMWSKFEDAVGIMEQDGEKPESMELYPDNIEGYEDEDGVFHFTKFSFDGCCILSNSKLPAMEDANIRVNNVQFSFNDFAKEIKEELHDIYMMFTQLTSKKENNESELQNNNGEGGNDDMATEFSQTVMQMFEDISNIVRAQEEMDSIWGDKIPRYYLVDVQENEVIVADRANNYQYYGCEFSMDGDKPVVNFDSAKRKKITYADYVDGETAPEGAFDFGKHISDIENTAFAKVSEAEQSVESANEAKGKAETEYADLKAEFDEMKPKYEAYEKAEAERVEAETKKAKEDVIAQYEVALKDEEKFVELKGKLDEYATADDVEAKCAVMYARKNISTNFSVEGKKNSTVLGASAIEDEVPDGYVKTKYGLVRTGR